MDLIKVAEQAFAGEKKELPAFKAGDQITVGYRIKEGNKERVQEFRGDVICIHGSGDKKRFTVRKMSGNVGVSVSSPWTAPSLRALLSTSTVRYVVPNSITCVSVRVRKPASKSAASSKPKAQSTMYTKKRPFPVVFLCLLLRMSFFLCNFAAQNR